MADALLDAITRHQIWTQQLATTEARKIDPVMKDIDRIIRSELSKTERIETRTQLSKLVSTLRRRIKAIYGDWTTGLLDDFEDIADAEADFVMDALNRITTDAEADAPKNLSASILNRPIQTNDNGESALLVPLLSAFTRGETERVLGTVRNGYSKGWTNAEIVRRLRGTKANNFKDGILAISRRHGETIAITGTNHVANTAKAATYHANSDIVQDWTFVATLDSRTTNICRFHDGTEHDLGEGPVPPLHLRCRSTQVPNIKSEFSILGKQATKTRASKAAAGGGTTKKSPYYEWLETQPKWFQEETLGTSKTELFRKGGLSADEFRRLTSDRFGEPLTLDEIRAKNPDAWRDAGL